MNSRNTKRPGAAEAGVALLISLFTLLLICVVGVALIMATGTDSALTGNYRSATGVYYAALAGMEEGRGRMLPKSPNNLPTALGFPGTVPTIGPGNTAQVWYIINPLPGEPGDIGMLTLYPDTDYPQEFPGIAANIQTTLSVSSQSQWQGAPIYSIYKWVRINAITATSAQNAGVNVNQGAGPQNSALLYANNHLSVDQPGPQALQITALAAMPNGSQRMLQYVVAPVIFFGSPNGPFPAALTLDGNNVNFTGPGSNQFLVNGADILPVGACAPGVTPMAGIGFTNNTDTSQANIVAGIPPANVNNYTGAGGLTPNVNPISLPVNWETPSGLQLLAQTVGQNADTPIVNSTPYIASTATGANLPAAMSALNPMTTVVNGDLDLSAWSGTGYGILLVTGELTLNSNANWNGVVLVIGKGIVDATAGTGQMNGAVLLAQAYDPLNNWALLPDPNLGKSWWKQTGGSGVINYSSCWIQAVQMPFTYKILSFREIPLPAP